MLKKIIFGCIGLMIASPVMAVTMKVEALTPFSTENPQPTMSVKLLEDCELSDTLFLLKGDTLSGKTTDVVSPKRLKRDATFSFIPETFTDTTGVTHHIEGEYKGKYAFPLDKKDLAKNATLTVGSFFVKGLSLGYNAIEGAVKNEEGNRFKSSAVNVYENTPFSYVETGNELNILTGDIFLLKFKTSPSEEDEENEESEQGNTTAPQNSNYTTPTTAEPEVVIPQQLP